MHKHLHCLQSKWWSSFSRCECSFLKSAEHWS